MSTHIREIQQTVKRPWSKDTRPTIIQWKDQRIIRNHSMIECVKEIIYATESQDVVNVNLIGDPHTGKTTIADTLGHLVHKISKIPFSVRTFQKKDLLNIEETLKGLSPANYVLKWDDVSFLSANASRQQVEKVKQASTEIRHLEGGKDVKIINVKNFHYTLGLDKYLRQNDFTFFFSVGSSEDDNMEKIVGNRFMPLVRSFKIMRTRIKIAPEAEKKFSYRLLPNEPPFTYRYRKPFIPLLFWNNDSLRTIVAPTREWLDPVCSICTEYGNTEKFTSQVDIAKFIEEGNKAYTESVFKKAVVLKLYTMGINVTNKNVVSASKFLDKCLATKNISLEEIATYYKFKPNKTKMRKDVDAILERAAKVETLPEQSKVEITNGLDGDIKLEEDFPDGT